jgi:tRNA_anti-like
MTDGTTEPKKRSWIKIGCLGIIGFFVAMTALGLLIQTLDPEGSARRAAEAEERRSAEEEAEVQQKRNDRLAEIESALPITSLQLSSAYDANEVAAQQQFGDRPLLISGTVTGISLDLLDQPIVSLNSINEFLSVQASLSDADAAGQLQKGQEVRMLCQKVTEVISAPQLSDCELVE